MIRYIASEIWINLTNPSYRKERLELKRLHNLPRYQEGHTFLVRSGTKFADGPSFVSAYRAIFQRSIYQFRAKSPSPRILDVGANIGLATQFWKNLYPSARITAFEPDPSIFKILSENIKCWDLSQIECIEAAAWTKEGSVSFWSEGADGGRVQMNSQNSGEKKVKTIDLRSYLQEPIDFLKMDIEGSEAEVLLACKDELKNIDKMFIEYHSFKNQEQRLDEILHLLRSQGFRFQIENEHFHPNPWEEVKEILGMDLMVNLYCSKS